VIVAAADWVCHAEAAPVQPPLPAAPERRRRGQRHQIVVLHRHGIPPPEIAGFCAGAVSTVYRWTGRAANPDWRDRKRPGRPLTFSTDIQVRLMAFYCPFRPLAGSGQWTIRWAATYLQAHPEHLGVAISPARLHRRLRQHHLKPHQSKYSRQITDPDFFPKMEPLIALYTTPPKPLFFFAECPGIQILTRLAPDMRTAERQRGLKEFEYNRQGTLEVLAVLEAQTGKVFARCTFDHKSATFLELFEDHVRQQPGDARLDYVMDNLSTHSVRLSSRRSQ
jgi:hypothetical protein